MPNPLYSPQYTQSFPITPSDTGPVQGPKQSNGKPLPYCRGIHVTVAGNVTACFKDDNANATVTFPVLVTGQPIPYSLAWVFSSTTATLIGLL